jgi:hypothetical protein
MRTHANFGCKVQCNHVVVLPCLAQIQSCHDGKAAGQGDVHRAAHLAPETCDILAGLPDVFQLLPDVRNNVNNRQLDFGLHCTTAVRSAKTKLRV